MNKIAILFFIFFAFSLRAQSPKNLNWTKGFIQLPDLSQQEGHIHFDDKKDLVSFKSEQEFKVYEPHELRGFQLLDTKKGIYRKYGSYKGKQRKYFFCEQIVTGECHFLMKKREAEVNRWITPYSSATVREKVTDFSYYLWYKQKLIKLKSSPKEIKILYEIYHLDLKEVTKKFQLSTYKPVDQAKLVHILNEKLRVKHQPKGLQVDLGY